MTKSKTSSAVEPEALEKFGELVAKAAQSRLNGDDERQAIEILKTLLLAGKAGIETATPFLTRIPWNICVDSVAAAWPELKATARKQLMTALAAGEPEIARRQRMSVARGLFAQDPATSAKLITTLAVEILENETPSPKDFQNFANVFIGKAKPWLLNLPLSEWKSADPVACVAVQAALKSPPFTQSWVLRWVASAKKLAKLPQPLQEAFAKEINRWQNKLKKESSAELTELPEIFQQALVLREEKPAQPPQKPKEQRPREQRPPEAAISAPESQDEPPSEEAAGKIRFESGETEETPAIPVPATVQSGRPPRPQRQDRKSEAQPKRQDARQQPQRQESQGFDVQRALRQIDEQFQRLRAELMQAKSQAARTKDRPLPRQGLPTASVEEIETLRRHNFQLEQTVNELRTHLDELAQDHEDRAAIMQVESDPVQQFRELLAVKLKESYSAAESLRNQSMSDVVRQGYREIVGTIFSVLTSEGIRLSE